MTTQTANFTFTNDELTLALTTAWQDSFVGTVVWDSSTQYVLGQYIYPVPSTMTVVRDIYIIKPETTANTDEDNYPEKIDQSLYEIINGSIYFLSQWQNFVNDTVTLYIKGYNPLTVSNSLPSNNIINYVLWLAADTLMQQLLLKSAFVFLRNDTSIAAIVNAQKITATQVLKYKQRLFREFESI
jgi:hypothetical protein